MTVSLKGTIIGTMTDATGHYFLKNLPEGEFTLSVSAVGYKSQERKVVLKRGKTWKRTLSWKKTWWHWMGGSHSQPQ